jgi:hypothetical protein
MAKGAAFRAYYEANRERLLAAQRERAKARREGTSDEERAGLREAAQRRRAKAAAESFAAKAEHSDGDWKIVFATLAKAADLGAITKKQMDWLLALRSAPGESLSTE